MKKILTTILGISFGVGLIAGVSYLLLRRKNPWQNLTISTSSETSVTPGEVDDHIKQIEELV